ncbi:MAG: Collagen alpha 1(I) chain precursor [uncultured Propionibacteriaceae bacterium]|uniref:Collagen alpha 1(I) chain n=1 Tax=uncultured Propionibacteriaceae bacterium TaxID=257457 RepID=A0A6J4NMQ8_9ACTN|nr:MAG: Collagen alpha 1(I) chain precursor [uncultured Propionibacteriaceae bacterium]
MAEDRQPGSEDQPEDEAGQSGSEPDRPGSGGTQQPGGGKPVNPFEALFAQLGLGPMGAGQMGAGQMGFGQQGSADMSGLLEQLQSAFAMLGGSMFTPGAGDSGSGVNWDVTKDTARKTVAGLGADPSPTTSEQRAVSEAASIAEVWLDAATSFPQTGTVVAAWSRADWVEQTMPVWRRLVEPVAASIADAMEGALKFGGGAAEAGAIPGLAGMEQMLRPMLRSSGASMFGLQLGQGLGQLATEVVGATDIGLPLSEPGHVALLPTNVKAFGKGLEQTPTDVTLYLALRECARQRLFAAATWLRSQMLTLVEEYARGITIDTSALEQAVNQIDPTNLEELSQSLEGGLFEPRKTPEQVATLERLETMLALVEGWVDEVVTQATAPWMPAAAALAETVRRNRATGGPAEATFATLVGLELRPRRMRDAANLWAALRDARGLEGRDAVWTHPDLIPTSADLDDPLGFISGERRSAREDDFDAALAELLDAAEAGGKEPEVDRGSDDPDELDGPDDPDGRRA